MMAQVILARDTFTVLEDSTEATGLQGRTLSFIPLLSYYSVHNLCVSHVQGRLTQI